MIPEFLKIRLENEYTQDEVQKIISGLSSNIKTTFRVNNLKSSCEEVESILEKNNIKYKKVDWYDKAYILESEFDLKSLDLYKEGKIYLQSLSSMIPPLMLDPKPNENILDMCAAPGSKTSEISALSDNKCYITAIEKNKIRCERLKYNLEKQGVKNSNVMQEDARNLSDFFKFDKILLDVPCSGSGTKSVFSKDFTEDLINRSTKFQTQLLEKALKLINAGNVIIYSTCSILKEENEDILAKFSDRIEILEIKKILPTEEFEGFFVAKIKKVK